MTEVASRARTVELDGATREAFANEPQQRTARESSIAHVMGPREAMRAACADDESEKIATEARRPSVRMASTIVGARALGL